MGRLDSIVNNVVSFCLNKCSTGFWLFGFTLLEKGKASKRYYGLILTKKAQNSCPFIVPVLLPVTVVFYALCQRTLYKQAGLHWWVKHPQSQQPRKHYFGYEKSTQRLAVKGEAGLWRWSWIQEPNQQKVSLSENKDNKAGLNFCPM